MKNLICLVSVLTILCSCQSRPVTAKNSVKENEKTKEIVSQNTKGTKASNQTGKNTSSNMELPASKYFKVVNVIKAQYIENSQFEMELEILNNTDYKFSKFELFAQIQYKMKNSDEICKSTAQYNAYNPVSVKNWEPHTKIKFSFVTPTWSSAGGCYSAKYDRTPEKIVLVLKPYPAAISVDLEVEDTFAEFDLLPLWKERQVKEGLR